jgi:hypothetical protein
MSRARRIANVVAGQVSGFRVPERWFEGPQAQKGKTCIYEGKQRWLDVHPRAASWQRLWWPRDWSLGSL